MAARYTYHLLISSNLTQTEKPVNWDGSYADARKILVEFSGTEPSMDLPEDLREEFCKGMVKELNGKTEIEFGGPMKDNRFHWFSVVLTAVTVDDQEAGLLVELPIRSKCN